jgi:hypothetical protein
MRLFSVLIPLALASGALSGVLVRSAASSCAAGNCARAVTGIAAKPAITQRNSDCLSKADATTIVNDFINLITYTQSNFNTTLANQLLADDFTDSSDSIDYISEAPVRETSVISTSPSRVCVICVQPPPVRSKLPQSRNHFYEITNASRLLQLGSVTFASKKAFIKGQGSQPPFPSVTTLNILYTCHEITWRFQLNTTPLPVRGIDIFVTNSAKQIKTIFAEFNSGAFLFNQGRPECLANWTASVQH